MTLDAMHLVLIGLSGLALGVAAALGRRLRQSRAETRAATARLAERQRDLAGSRRRARELAVMAKSAKALRNEFLSNISHEVRTPMNIIMGMTELALATDLSDRQRRYLQRVRDAGSGLLGLLNDLLDLSKIHARRLRVAPHSFRLRDCVRDVAGKFESRARRKGLDLSVKVAGNTPDAVVGDAGRLRQVLGAILSNAVKFSDRGEVTVAVWADPPHDGTVRVRFAVRDEGIGIPREKQAGIFEAFRQVDGSETRPYGGIGIGLAIASELVHLMGGRIDLESRPGEGATFRLEVPLGLQRHENTRTACGEDTPLAGRTALLVNDHPDMREAIREMLSERGLQVQATPTGAARQCLDRARHKNRPFDILILDAFALAEQLAAEAAGPEPMRIAMITSAGGRGDALRCRELGLAAYLTFPLSGEELAQAVARILETPRGKTGNLVTNHSLREQRHNPLEPAPTIGSSAT